MESIEELGMLIGEGKKVFERLSKALKEVTELDRILSELTYVGYEINKQVTDKIAVIHKAHCSMGGHKTKAEIYDTLRHFWLSGFSKERSIELLQGYYASYERPWEWIELHKFVQIMKSVEFRRYLED